MSMEEFINAVIRDGFFKSTSDGDFLHKDCHLFYRIKNRHDKETDTPIQAEFVVCVSDTFGFLAERDDTNGADADWTIVFRTGEQSDVQAWATAHNCPAAS